MRVGPAGPPVLCALPGTPLGSRLPAISLIQPTSGTISLTLLPERASQVADQLVAIVAEMYRVAQS